MACGEPIQDVDLDDSLATERGCGDSCSSDSASIGSRLTLQSHAHGVVGEVVLVNDATVAIEGFGFDGGGLDVRAIVGDSVAAMRDGAYEILSEDLRRAGGYVDARLELTLPDGLTVDDVGVFSIWCLPANANLAHAELL